MFNLELDMDEGIVLQATEVERYGIKETSLNEMVLTNKNIICVYNKSTGMFSKPETVVEKIPLSTIKVVNGKAQVMIHDNDDYGLGVPSQQKWTQKSFKKRNESYSFFCFRKTAAFIPRFA